MEREDRSVALAVKGPELNFPLGGHGCLCGICQSLLTATTYEELGRVTARHYDRYHREDHYDDAA